MRAGNERPSVPHWTVLSRTSMSVRPLVLRSVGNSAYCCHASIWQFSARGMERERERGREGEGRKGSRKEVTRRLHTGPARTLARSSTLIQSFCCRHATDIICTKEPQMPARAGLAREGTKGRKGEERKVRERRNGRRACMESPSVKKRHKSWSGKQGRELESLNSPLNRVREAPSGCN